MWDTSTQLSLPGSSIQPREQALSITLRNIAQRIGVARQITAVGAELSCLKRGKEPQEVGRGQWQDLSTLQKDLGGFSLGRSLEGRPRTQVLERQWVGLGKVPSRIKQKSNNETD